MDGLSRALVDTAPTLNAILRTDRLRCFRFHPVNFAGADLYAIPATVALIQVNDGIHNADAQNNVFTAETPRTQRRIFLFGGEMPPNKKPVLLRQ